MKTIPDLLPIIQEMSRRYGIPASIILAIIEQESGFNEFAYRFEPSWYERLGKIPSMSPTERAQRSASWGLMQCLGQTVRETEIVAREPHIKFLTALTQPQVAISFGCRILQEKIKSRGSVPAGILAYNGGGRPTYLDEVLAKQTKYLSFDVKVS